MYPGATAGGFGSSATGNSANYNNITNWTSRDTIAWWMDGSSNQLLFTEKFIPAWAYSEDNADANDWDGGYHYTATNSHAANLARVISKDVNMFGRGPNDPNRPPTANRLPSNREGNEMLGSMHPGVVNFLIGDGSVRPIPINTLPALMWQLGSVNDGNPASLP